MASAGQACRLRFRCIADRAGQGRGVRCAAACAQTPRGPRFGLRSWCVRAPLAQDRRHSVPGAPGSPGRSGPGGAGFPEMNVSSPALAGAAPAQARRLPDGAGPHPARTRREPTSPGRPLSGLGEVTVSSPALPGIAPAQARRLPDGAGPHPARTRREPTSPGRPLRGLGEVSARRRSSAARDIALRARARTLGPSAHAPAPSPQEVPHRLLVALHPILLIGEFLRVVDL